MGLGGIIIVEMNENASITIRGTTILAQSTSYKGEEFYDLGVYRPDFRGFTSNLQPDNIGYFRIPVPRLQNHKPFVGYQKHVIRVQTIPKPWGFLCSYEFYDLIFS